jgi:hypothetical protein
LFTDAAGISPWFDMPISRPKRKAMIMPTGAGMWILLLVTTWGMYRFSGWIVPRDDVEGRMGNLNSMLAEAFFGWGSGLLWIEGTGGVVFLVLLWKELGGGRE